MDDILNPETLYLREGHAQTTETEIYVAAKGQEVPRLLHQRESRKRRSWLENRQRCPAGEVHGNPPVVRRSASNSTPVPS